MNLKQRGIMAAVVGGLATAASMISHKLKSTSNHLSKKDHQKE